MTILHVTDLHFRRGWFDWLLHRAPPHHLLVISGDLLQLGSTTPLRAQIGWVSRWLSHYPRPLCVCSGYHDLEWNPTLQRWTPAYWLRHVRNSLLWADGARIGWGALSVDIFACTARPHGSEADIWIAHTPPSGTRVSTRLTGGDGGEPSLREAMRRYHPRLVLSGHVHASVHWCDHGDRTLCLNPGRGPDSAPFPQHILVHVESLSCRFVAAPRDLALSAPADISAAV